jgi:hypothetical protein
LQSVRQLFEKYSEIRYQNKTLYEIEEKIWTTYTLNQILLRTIPNNIEDPNKVEDQQNLIRIVANLTHIDNYAFYYNNLRSITIPDSVRRIGNNAFANNNLLEQVTIPIKFYNLYFIIYTL